MRHSIVLFAIAEMQPFLFVINFDRSVEVHRGGAPGHPAIGVASPPEHKSYE